MPDSIILPVSGNGVILENPPGDLILQESSFLQAFVEKEVTLTQDLDISDPADWTRNRLGVVPAGTTITSVYIFLSPLEDPTFADATFFFGGEILGVIGNRTDLEFTNGLLGLEGVTYLAGESLENSEFAGTRRDSAVISGNQLDLSFGNRARRDVNKQDMIRVILDINAPPQDIALTNTVIDENINGAAIGILSATDLDNDAISFSVTDPRFEIVDVVNGGVINPQLKLKVGEVLNAETAEPITIDVTATDNGIPNKSTVQSFTLTVNNVNDAPTDLLLTNSTLDENLPVGAQVGTLSTQDEDLGDSHLYSLVPGVGGTDNTRFEIVGNELRTRETFDLETQATYSLRVQTLDAGGLPFEKILTISLNNIDEAPTVQTPIADVIVLEDAANNTIDLSGVFTDIDFTDEEANIVKTIKTNSNPSLVVPTVSGNALTLDYQTDQFGTAEITIEATSNGKTVTDTFQVTVLPDDDGPRIQTEIADVVVDEDAANTTLDLSAVFIDIDTESAAIIKTVKINSNPGLVTPNISGNTLTLDYLENQVGTAEITV
ncbi:MAG: hypothetical protein ACRC8A_21020, partial [Microcoleaceae cyanobacterium]